MLLLREPRRLTLRVDGESVGLVGSGDDNGELAFNSGSCSMPERQRESTSAQLKRLTARVQSIPILCSDRTHSVVPGLGLDLQRVLTHLDRRQIT